MLSEEERRRAADALLRAEQERKPIVQLSKTYPNIEIDDAYRIQTCSKRIPWARWRAQDRFDLARCRWPRR